MYQGSDTAYIAAIIIHSASCIVTSLAEYSELGDDVILNLRGRQGVRGAGDDWNHGEKMIKKCKKKWFFLMKKLGGKEEKKAD